MANNKRYVILGNVYAVKATWKRHTLCNVVFKTLLSWNHKIYFIKHNHMNIKTTLYVIFSNQMIMIPLWIIDNDLIMILQKIPSSNCSKLWKTAVS